MMMMKLSREDALFEMLINTQIYQRQGRRRSSFSFFPFFDLTLFSFGKPKCEKLSSEESENMSSY